MVRTPDFESGNPSSNLGRAMWDIYVLPPRGISWISRHLLYAVLKNRKNTNKFEFFGVLFSKKHFFARLFFKKSLYFLSSVGRAWAF